MFQAVRLLSLFFLFISLRLMPQSERLGTYAQPPSEKNQGVRLSQIFLRGGGRLYIGYNLNA